MERLPHETWAARAMRVAKKGGKFFLEGVVVGLLDIDSDSGTDIFDDAEHDSKDHKKAIKAFYGAYAASRNEIIGNMDVSVTDRNNVVQAAALCLRAATKAMSNETAHSNGLKYTWGGGFELPEGYIANARDHDDPVNRVLNALDRGNDQVQLESATRLHASEIMQAWTLFAYHNEQADPYSSQAAYPDIHPALQHASGSYAMSLRADFNWEDMGITEVDEHMHGIGLHATLFGLASHASLDDVSRQESVISQVQTSFVQRLATPLT